MERLICECDVCRRMFLRTSNKRLDEMYGSMDRALDIAPGVWVQDASRQLAEEAARTGSTVRAQFNDSPMVARPGDCARAVFLEWHYERLISQLKRGVVRVADLP